MLFPVEPSADNLGRYGNVETDEVYVGVNNQCQHYVSPEQAKGSKDETGVIKFKRHLALCHCKFSGLISCVLAAHYNG